jgi:dTDP-4-dehydrorhamnose 3,5-epimerase
MSALPAGVSVLPLTTHTDHRGSVSETFRSDWAANVGAAQWTYIRTHANVIRGMHCHRLRTDFVTVMEGAMRVVLADVRPEAPGPTLAVIELDATTPRLVIIPPGVAHAFETRTSAITLCGLDTGWTTEDELGCSWTDPAIAAAFVATKPLLSERDATAGTFAELQAAYATLDTTTRV